MNSSDFCSGRGTICFRFKNVFVYDLERRQSSNLFNLTNGAKNKTKQRYNGGRWSLKWGDRKKEKKQNKRARILARTTV